ncbi:MAG: inositol monophosphatase [Ilumatobacteraceae bacterium]|jgi:myo-inositol-1(or 4)-monophosphatase|nr:inositol monophosphatase [Ilumatobacteraceae bacterium]
MDAPTDLVNLAARLAREAGDMVANGRRTGDLGVRTKSTATDMVTRWDSASESLIVDALRAARPRDGIVGEEGSRVDGTSGIDWYVDPIDGTTNFLYGLGGYAVSIAAADSTGPVAGAVFVPASRELFTAARGRGAFLGSTPITCSTSTTLDTALVATGFSYDSDHRRVQGSRVGAMLPHVRDIRRLGAAAIDLCHVACGRVDAYFEEHLQAWDLAAGLLIATEAGARASDFAGGAVKPSETVVCAPGIHTALLEHLQRTA